MKATGFTLFDTALGLCGIAWAERGIVGIRLPDKDANAMRARLARRFPEAVESTPPPVVQSAIDAIVALLAGDPADLSGIDLDMTDVPDFERSVYRIARTIPPGSTITYGEIAAALGDKLLSRDVGQALGKNPFPIVVPCHRVLAAGGKPGGFSAPGGLRTKRRMLAIESAHAKGEPTLFDALAQAPT